MIEDIFSIDKFNIIQDEENYYFFRALNRGDNNDIENGIVVDESGEYIRIRTDRERWEEDPEKKEPKYTEDAQITLQEINDHIKMHQRKDTNCISLSSNANVSIVYGRGYYSDKYIMVKVPKKEMGQKVVNAGQYMLEEIEKRINEVIATLDDIEILDALNQIDNSTTEEEIKEIIEIKYQLKETYKRPKQRHEKIALATPHTRTSSYQALSEEQSLEKNKIIGKLTILERKGLIEPLIPNTSKNTSLIRTVGNAFSSSELIHYGDIERDEIIDVPKEIMDIFALLQQMDESKEIVQEIEKEVIGILASGKTIEIPTTLLSDGKNKKDISIEEMYEITGGKISYGKANSAITKMFYLSRSRLRAKELANFLNEITGYKPAYQEVIRKIEETGFSIEPEIVTRQNNRGYQLSESVNLDLSEQEEKIIPELQSLTNESLLEIYQNGGLSNIKEILTKIYQEENNTEITKERYIAEAIVDTFDWSSIGVGELTVTQRAQIIEKVENNELELTKNLTIEQLETALGYYDVEGTNITLRTHQQIAVDKADELLEEKRFASVILPTGAGKSFVALAELLKHKDEKILYLAPSNEILEQIQKYIIEFVHGTKGTLGKTSEEIVKEVFPNLQLATYASLNGKNGKETIENNYDFIILDELHRTGAEKWGKKLEKLLENQDEEVKVLGITATPERDMDGRNMADEIAAKLGYTDKEIEDGKHIASNMSIIEAIRLGIILNPKVVSCEYTLNEDGSLEKLLERINSIEDEKLRNEKIARLDKLRRNLEKAKGKEEILKEHVEEGEKYIVFIPVTEKENGKEAEEKINEKRDELLKTFPNAEIYSMLGKYSDKKNSEQLNGFENSKSKGPKFMIVMNKLNEGVHIKGVKGIIWERALDESSKILALQQMGRIIRAINPGEEVKDEDRPIIIDIANNLFHVRLNEKLKTYEARDDLILLRNIADWIEIHNGHIPDINSKNKEEAQYGKTLKRIQEKYEKYLDGFEEEIEEEEQEKIEKILAIGKEIDLWNIELPEKIQKEERKEEKIEEFGLIGYVRDFYELEKEVEEIENKTALQRLIEVLLVLQANGVELRKGSIQSNDKIIDVLIKQNISKEVQEKIEKEIKVEDELEWPIGVRITTQKNATNRDKFRKGLKEVGLPEELADEVREKTALQELIEVLLVLQANGVELKKGSIQQREKIIDVLTRQNISKEVQEKIEKEIEVELTWPIGIKRDKQKSPDKKDKFREALKEVGLPEELADDFRDKTALQKLIEILLILQVNGVELKKGSIQGNDKIIDVLKKQNISKEVQAKIEKEIKVEDGLDWPISRRIKDQKDIAKDKFREALKDAGLPEELATVEIREKTALQELIEVLLILQVNGVELKKGSIQGNDKIIDVLTRQNISKEIQEKIVKEIEVEDSLNWPIESRMEWQKSVANRDKFREALKEAGLPEELASVIDRDATPRMIEILLILQANGVELKKGSIVKGDKIIDILKKQNISEKIKEKIEKEITVEDGLDWPIGMRLDTQKQMGNKFREALKKAGLPEELADLIEKDATKEMIEVLTVLQVNGIELKKGSIQGSDKIIDVLTRQNISKEIQEKIEQKVTVEGGLNWAIGWRMGEQRTPKKKDKFRRALKEAKLSEELADLIEKDATKELIEVLLILQANGVELKKGSIKDKEKLISVLEKQNISKEVQQKIEKEITVEGKLNWPIGTRIREQKNPVNNDKFREALKKANLPEELADLIEKDATKELIKVLLILRANGVALNIKQSDKLIDVLKKQNISKEVQEKIEKEITVEKGLNWPIGSRIDTQKGIKWRNKFREALKEAGLPEELADVKPSGKKCTAQSVGQAGFTASVDSCDEAGRVIKVKLQERQMIY